MQHPQEYDIVIIGAGPAGANFARLIDSKRYRVLLVDASCMRAKVCAGLLSPDAQKRLTRYSILLPQEIFVEPQLSSVRVIDLDYPRTRHYRRTYLNVDRDAFDCYLRSLVPNSVDLKQAQCREIVCKGEKYQLTLRSADGRDVTVAARFIVGADGAASIVRSTLFPDRKIQKYVAIQQWFEAGKIDPYYSCVFDHETSESCSWIFFKDGQLVFGGAFSPRGCRSAFEAQKRKLVACGIVSSEVFASPVQTEACRVSRPHLNEGVFHGADGAYLIGEAAGFISPSSFEGISYALDSSEALALAFRQSTSEPSITRAYRKKTAWLCRKVKSKCLKRPFMYVPFLRRLILKTGVGASKRK